MRSCVTTVMPSFGSYYIFGPAEVAEALRNPKNPLGRLSADEARALALSAGQSATLSGEYKDLIWENLVRSFRA